MITKRFKVPTGDIAVIDGEHGPLELVSLGDYGKDVNLNQGSAVPDSLPLLPLTEKWVITISTQYGCSMGCAFCDVPKVGAGRNATLADLDAQIVAGMSLHPDVTWSRRLNVHYARMGEPTFNFEVLRHALWMRLHLESAFTVHPVVSTMMPHGNKRLREFVCQWMRVKNETYKGDAGLQLSINSTDEGERVAMFNGNACTLAEAGDIMSDLVPVGRKITLNFAVADWTIDPDVLLRHFSPEHYIVKLTPMHRTATALGSSIETPGDYTTPAPYEHHAEALRAAGYDVLVFIASRDEDEGLITCGNAILSGTTPRRLRAEPLRFVEAR